MKYNSHGFTLVEVLVTTGLIGILAFGITQLTTNINQTQKFISQKDVVRGVVSRIDMTLQDKLACERTFAGKQGGQTISAANSPTEGHTVNRIYDGVPISGNVDSNRVIYSTNTLLREGGVRLRLEAMKLVITSSAANTTFPATLNVSLAKVDANGAVLTTNVGLGPIRSTRRIPLQIVRGSGTNIVGCYSSGDIFANSICTNQFQGVVNGTECRGIRINSNVANQNSLVTTKLHNTDILYSQKIVVGGGSSTGTDHRVYSNPSMTYSDTGLDIKSGTVLNNYLIVERPSNSPVRGVLRFGSQGSNHSLISFNALTDIDFNSNTFTDFESGSTANFKSGSTVNVTTSGFNIGNSGDINVNSGGDINVNSGGDIHVKNSGDIVLETGADIYHSAGSRQFINRGSYISFQSPSGSNRAEIYGYPYFHFLSTTRVYGNLFLLPPTSGSETFSTGREGPNPTSRRARYRGYEIATVNSRVKIICGGWQSTQSCQYPHCQTRYLHENRADSFNSAKFEQQALSYRHSLGWATCGHTSNPPRQFEDLMFNRAQFETLNETDYDDDSGERGTDDPDGYMFHHRCCDLYITNEST